MYTASSQIKFQNGPQKQNSSGNVIANAINESEGSLQLSTKKVPIYGQMSLKEIQKKQRKNK